MNHIMDIPGGKWWKIDFHLHSPASYDYGNGASDEQEQKDISPMKFLECCMRNQLDCIVVADHNTTKWVSKLRDALTELSNSKPDFFREIIIFPGIEIQTLGNTHVIGIFDPSLKDDKLNQIIGKFDFTEDSGQTNLICTRKSTHEIIEIINTNGGIAIPAHVDKSSGLFDAAPTEIRSVFDNTGVLALEVTEPEITNQIYIDKKLKLAYVLGSDSHHTSTIGHKFTWVKMGDPNIVALRLALYDARDSAIRSIESISSPNEIRNRTYIKELTIENGKYIGRRTPYKISFSPWLTNIIGGRGTGKSSVLKFIRLLLNKEDELPESLKKEFTDFACVPKKRSELGMLLSSQSIETKVTLIIVVDGVEHSLMWKGNTTYEFISSTSEWTPVVAIEERFPVQMFSQKQLYELTSDPDLLFKYIDKQWDVDEWSKCIREIRQAFFDNQREIRSLNEKFELKSSLDAQLRDIEAKLAVFETETTKQTLVEQNALNNNKKLIEAIYAPYKILIESVDQLKTSPVAKHSSDLSSLDDESRLSLEQWVHKMDLMESELAALFEKYKAECVHVDDLFSRLKLRELINTNAVVMSKIIEELKASGVDGIEKYAELLETKKELVSKVDAIGEISALLKSHEEQSIQLMNSLTEQLSIRFQKRNAIISHWNAKGQLQLTLHPLANSKKNVQTFREIIRKESEYASDIYEEYEDGRPTTGFIASILELESGKDIFKNLSEKKRSLLLSEENTSGKRFNAYLSKLFEQYPTSKDEILMWIPEDRVELKINVGTSGKPDYRTIDAGSPGQRTSAILSLIFSLSNTPIIIDQPEDDLDTRNITSIVVNGIKEIKRRQQVILVTHNPNIVVNTNSEQIVHLDYVNGEICNACMGALQNREVRDAICHVMEGGKDALEKRYYRIFKALESR